MKNFELYRGAASRVREGWARGHWRDEKGRVCLVQSILDESGIFSAAHLPEGIIEEIGASLQQYPSYRLMRAVLGTGSTPLETITGWNDCMGTQRRVARVLDHLADDKELEFLRAEQVRLQIEVHQLQRVVENLRAHKATLESKITDLEAQNGWLRRQIKMTLANDRRELHKLDRHLDATWAELTRTQNDLTSDRFAPLLDT